MWLRTTQTSWKAFLLAQLLLVTTHLQISVASCQHVSEVTALFQLLISYLFLFFIYVYVCVCMHVTVEAKGKKGHQILWDWSSGDRVGCG